MWAMERCAIPSVHGLLNRRQVWPAQAQTVTLPTFVTLLGKVELGDHRPSERTRFSEKLYPAAFVHHAWMIVSVCLHAISPFALKELRLTFGEAAEVMAGRASQREWRWQENRKDCWMALPLPSC